MSNFISINIETLKKLSQSFSHNLRFQKPSYLIDLIDKNINTSHNDKVLEVYNRISKMSLDNKKTFIDRYQRKIENFIKQDYSDHNKQKFQAKTVIFKEALVSFGMEQFENNKVEDINKALTNFVDKFQKDHKVKILSHSLHLDEGHINANGEKEKNYHAHFQIINYDFDNHRTCMRNVNLKKLQSELADEFKSLGFIRGRDYSGEQKKENELAELENREPNKIKAPKHVSHNKYRQIKEDVYKELKADYIDIDKIKQKKIKLENEYSQIKNFQEAKLQSKKLKHRNKLLKAFDENILKKFKPIELAKALQDFKDSVNPVIKAILSHLTPLLPDIDTNPQEHDRSSKLTYFKPKQRVKQKDKDLGMDL